MDTYVMLTRLAHGSLESPPALADLESIVAERIRAECPDVRWLQNLAILGDYDYLDVFTAPSLEVAARVATLVRTFGHADIELWPAIPWSRFKEDVVEHLSGHGEGEKDLPRGP